MTAEAPEPAEQSNADWIAEYETPPTQSTHPDDSPDTGAYALEIWLSADYTDDAVVSHAYAINKGIASAGGAGRALVSGHIVGRDADCIVIPIHDLVTDKVAGVQCINPEGAKQTFGKVSGNGLLLGNTLDKSIGWFVAEGWASAYSVVFHHCGGNACCTSAFGKGNLEKVAQAVAEIYQPATLVLIEEQDGD